MTKKRFGMYQNTLYDNGDILNLFNAMKLLNHFDKENAKLKKENEKLKNKLIFFNELNKPYGDIIKENEQLKQQVEDLEFKLRTIEAYDRTMKEEHSDSVYDFKKKIEKW